MRRLLLWLAAAVAVVAVPTGGAAIASPTVRMAIVHVVSGCHVWATADSRPLGATRTITIRRGGRLEIRVNCVMDFRYRQTAGPALRLGDPLTHAGTVRKIVFKKAGVYRLEAASTKTSAEMGLETLGADNTLKLTIRVK